MSIKVTGITMDFTSVEIGYKVDDNIDKIELFGQDGGLSWDEGLSMELLSKDDDVTLFTVEFKFSTTCEFKAKVIKGEVQTWEEYTHKLKRLNNGRIIIMTDERILKSLVIESEPPKEFQPILKSIITQSVENSEYTIEIIYSGDSNLSGMELHGTNSGLNWDKGKSLLLHKKIDDEGMITYSGIIQVKQSINFKARAFRDKIDYWEDGKNHQLEIDESGYLQYLNSDLECPDILILHPPLDLHPSLEDVINRLSLDKQSPTWLLQYLVDTSFWFEVYQKDPMDQQLFNLISRMIRYIMTKAREYKSKSIDDITRPIMVALSEIYKSAISFLDEDYSLLINQWREDGLFQLFQSLPAKIEKLNEFDLGKDDDYQLRENELITYN